MSHTTDRPSIFAAPVWLTGFRPFFIATCISGATFPLIWVLAYSGIIEAKSPVFDPFISPLHWHIHEMFYGFGWALMGGFLLTATKNWVGIRGRYGVSLGLLVGLWALDRITMAYGSSWPVPLVYGFSLSFILVMVCFLEIDLIRNHTQDSYKDNAYFILALPLFVIAKAALLSKDVDPAIGASMTLGLFRLCFLLMLERTLMAFMKGSFGISLKKIFWVDHPIKLLGFALIFNYGLDQGIRTVLLLMAAFLMIIRWCYWHPFKALRRLDIGVMYLGYVAIIANLVLGAMDPMNEHLGVSAGTHIFTLGAIGLVAPAMIIRISNGHTGRKVSFLPIDKLTLYLMIAALIFRVFVPVFVPNLYTVCLYISASCWLLIFSILGYKYVPILLRPRIDGKQG